MQQGGLDPDATVDEVAGSVYFQMWTRRQSPFSVLEDGDTVYAVDGGSHTILWEFRVANLYRHRYTSQVDAFQQLDRVFGISPAECNDYVWLRPTEGWLMAFGVEVIRKLSIDVPDELNFVSLGGRNGWVNLEKLDRPMLKKLRLPKPEGRALAPPGAIGAVSDELSTDNAEMPDRFIPAGVKRLVLERDGRKCRLCGDDSDKMIVHFDHIYPWSKGGPNTASNLQILCSTCNMSKGAKVPAGMRRPDNARDMTPWQDQLERLRDLRALSADGDLDAALNLAEIVPDEGAELLLEKVIAAGSPDQRSVAHLELAVLKLTLEDLTEAARLARLAFEGTDEDAASQAAFIIAVTHDKSGPEQIQLLERARTCSDPWFSTQASLELAKLEDEGSARFIQLLEEAMQSPEQDVRSEAALWLSDVTEDDDERLGLLYEAFSSHEGRIRESAMIGLALEYYNQDWTPPVRPLLEHAAQSESTELANEAREFLSTLDLGEETV